MATYGTDLAVLATGSLADGSGTWTELIAPYALGGGAAPDTENFIQGSQSESQTLGNKTGLGFSIVFDAGSDISGSFATDDVVMAWVFFVAGTNLDSYANGGHRYVIAGNNTTLAADSWDISGNDRPPNPYGGWWNVAIDPTLTPDYTDGGGNGGAYQWFGSIVNILAKISKGTPHAVDAQRFGRGEIYCTGTGATFTLMAADNDAASARWGLLQDTGGGTFLWKGLMSLGQSGTSTTFAASNQTIVIDDTAKVYAAFNKIEIRHASSSITWDNISFNARGTVSKGQFEMVENAATVDLTGCSFNNMDTFIFLSNAALVSCVWNGCGLITAGGADFTSCTIANSLSSASIIAATLDNITKCSFESDGSNHAVELTSIGAGSMDWDNFLSGYVAGTSGSPITPTSTGNEAIYVNVATASDLTINVQTGADVPSIRVGASFTGSVNVIAGAVPLTVTAKRADNGVVVEDAIVNVEAGDALGDLFFEVVVTITASGTTATVAHTAHGLSTGAKVNIRDAVEIDYLGVQTITVTGVNSYTYVMANSPTSPATGTITSTEMILSGLTNASGIITASRTYTVDQKYRGFARKTDASPFYKTSNISGTLDKDIGALITANLSSDE